jgi:chromosomal replication initiation ATPase DnaA
MTTEGLTIDKRLDLVSGSHRLTFRDLCTPKKTQDLVQARQHMAFYLVIIEDYRLDSAGALLNQHHTTVLYSVRKYAAEKYGTAMDAKLREIRVAYIAKSQQDQAMERAA